MMTTPAVAPTCTTGRGPAGRCSAHTAQARTRTSTSARLSPDLVEPRLTTKPPNRTPLVADPRQLQSGQSKQGDTERDVPGDQFVVSRPE